jgi:eight-cysteine-cluster-containing protein
MSPFHKPLLLLSVLGLVMSFSGCTGLDPTALATSNSMIQQFLDEHPNAQIKVTHFTAEQSKNMIDQIRKDCDNPYVDEKEFYRVNVTDPDTNFYATVWIDWSTQTVECVFKVGTEGKTVEKPKENPACESHNYYKCYNNNLYWFDSCGNVQDKKEYCQYGCTEKECKGGCNSHAEYRCYGDHVYWFDSCGNKQDKKEYCNYGCENGFCKVTTEKTCEQAGGYCIWPSYATEVTSSSGGGGGSATTGMVVMTVATTSTSTVVNYQCKEGYEAAKYFCKESGICCVPKSVTESFCGSSTQGPCSSDSDCITSGCSGQICQSVSEDISSICGEHKDCYNAAKFGMSCKCEINTVTPSTTAAMIGESSTQGRCKWIKATAACTDSDGGKSYYKAGTVTANGQSLSDHCNDAYSLTEKYCYGNEIKAEVYQCTYGCKDGACLKTSACAQEGQQFSEVYTENYPEHCCEGLTEWMSGMDTRAVQNGTCVETGLLAGSPIGTCIKCGDGICGQNENLCNCAQDCQTSTCTDSDGGKDYYTEGYLSLNLSCFYDNPPCGGGAYFDRCEDSVLREFFCLDENPQQESYNCPNGCSNGACIQQTATGFQGFQIPSGGWQFTSDGKLTVQLANMVGAEINITSVQAIYAGSLAENNTARDVLGAGSLATFLISGLPALAAGSEYYINIFVYYTNLDTGMSYVSEGILTGTSTSS